MILVAIKGTTKVNTALIKMLPMGAKILASSPIKKPTMPPKSTQGSKGNNIKNFIDFVNIANLF
jgi:hypothetical protein